MPWQALVTLAGLLARGLESTFAASGRAVRIELNELLNRPEKRPSTAMRNRREYKKTAVKNGRTRRRSGEMMSAGGWRRSRRRRKKRSGRCCRELLSTSWQRRYRTISGCVRRKELLSRITINSGFVAPLHLLTGVLAYYDEEWTPVVDAYGRSVIRPGDPFVYREARKMQSFIFDCWLLWGPSSPICTCQEWHGHDRTAVRLRRRGQFAHRCAARHLTSFAGWVDDDVDAPPTGIDTGRPLATRSRPSATPAPRCDALAFSAL